MMRTAILLASAALAVSMLAMPAQANPLVEQVTPEVVGSCVVEDDTGNRDYKVCVRTDGPCPRVTYRGFFGEGTVPYCS